MGIHVNLAKPKIVVHPHRLVGAWPWNETVIYQGSRSDAPDVPLMLVYSTKPDNLAEGIANKNLVRVKG